MNIIKANSLTKIERVSLILVYVFLLTNAFLLKDSPIALISAICGITYTFFAGKGYPFCYLFGITGSAFYCFLSFKSALWGNLLLYAGYYLPMQVLGFFQWNKNLKQGEKEIVKTKLALKERILLSIISLILSFVFILVLYSMNDKSPIIDGATTVFSVAGMYLTVKRCIEQWFVWMIVNGLSLFMWLKIALNGENVYSTVIMWFVYFILAIYFYFIWKKELKNYD